MIYCACKYAPMEMMAGFGEKVERLDPSPAAFNCAEGCTHPNMCSFAKAVIEEVHAKGIRRLILTDCCDAMRRTYDALEEESSMEFLYLLPLPHKNNAPSIQLFQNSLQRFLSRYEQFSGRHFDAQKALDAYEQQWQDKPSLPEGAYISVAGAHGGKKLMAWAGDIFPGTPIVDDTCSGNRYLSQKISSRGDFVEQYAEALLNQNHPCMRMWRPEIPAVDESHPPVGTIVHTIKFCDYYGFEYMSLKNQIRGKSVKIETDTTGAASGQLRTRLEAFREELGNDMNAGEPDRNMKQHKVENANLSAFRSVTGIDSGVTNTDAMYVAGIDSGSASTDAMYVAGIDSGSASTDAVIMNEKKEILARVILPTASGAGNSSDAALLKALEQAGLQREDLSSIVTTGYGRSAIKVSDQAVTEITCHAKGAHFLDPRVRTVIDIGGQDSKVICIDENGKVQNFVMNDKCAAGTGRFLEMQARTMNLSMEEMSAAGLAWQKDLTITSMCTVFAESEVVSLIAENTPVSDIIHGLNKAIAKRTAVLVSRAGGAAPYMMTGGVARNAGVVKCLEEELHQKIIVSEDSQICGAIGACLAALERESGHR